MLKIKLFFSLYFLSTNLLALEYPDWAIKQELYYFIKQSQISEDNINPIRGTWHTQVSARDFSHAKISETDLFMPLQTALSLERSSQQTLLSDLDQIALKLKPTIYKYILDTRNSHRKRGSVCFWPYKLHSDNIRRHNFADSPKILHLFDHIDLPNDLDTSSRVASWLAHYDPKNKFITEFIETATNNISNKNKAYLTWVHDNKSQQNNNTDCVVNLNILATMGQLQLEHKLSTKTLAANEKSCEFINQEVAKNNLATCSNYYDSFSQKSLSYALAIKSGITCLEISRNNIFSQVINHAQQALKKPNISGTSLAELILSLTYLAQEQDKTNNYLALKNNLINKLKKLIKHNEDSAHIDPSSVFIGRFSQGIFDWHSRAYSTALVLEALGL